MHAAFCNFARHFHDPPLDEHTSQYLCMAEKLCDEMPSAFNSERDRRDAFENIFHSPNGALKQHVEFFVSPKISTAKESVARPDVVKTIDREGGPLVLVLEEFKMESEGDVYMQICRSYEVLCGEARNERLVNFGYPVFLLCVLGRHRNVDPE
jgi:hypothetical protein